MNTEPKKSKKLRKPTLIGLAGAALICSIIIPFTHPDLRSWIFPPAKVDSPEQLGRNLLNALKQNDFEKFQGCWITLDQALPYFESEFSKDLTSDPKSHPRGVFLSKYYKQRDIKIKESFQEIQNRLKEQQQDIQDFHFKRTEHGEFSERSRKFIKAGNATFYFRNDKTDFILEYYIDDVGIFDGDWKLMDKPWRLSFYPDEAD